MTVTTVDLIRELQSPDGWQTPAKCEFGHCVRVKNLGDVVIITASWNPFDKAILTAVEWADLKESIKNGEYDDKGTSRT